MKELTIAVVDDETDVNAALDIRREVFCVEQGVDESEEIDGLDPECRHYLARLAGEPVGTARTRFLANAGGVKIERVAVLKSIRGRGIGKAIMIRVLEDITVGRAVLNAQLQVENFYARLGFVAKGDVFQEAGIEHVRMVRSV